MKIHQKRIHFINSGHLMRHTSFLLCEISHYFVLHTLRPSVVGSFSSDLTIFPDKVLLKVSGYLGRQHRACLRLKISDVWKKNRRKDKQGKYITSTKPLMAMFSS